MDITGTKGYLSEREQSITGFPIPVDITFENLREVDRLVKVKTFLINDYLANCDVVRHNTKPPIAVWQADGMILDKMREQFIANLGGAVIDIADLE